MWTRWHLLRGEYHVPIESSTHRLQPKVYRGFRVCECRSVVPEIMVVSSSRAKRTDMGALPKLAVA